MKHIKIRSAAPSEFWGRPMYVAADVLLPLGYDDPANASVRYPMNVAHGHYDPQAPRGFLKDGSNDFSAYWLSGTAPKFIVVAFPVAGPVCSAERQRGPRKCRRARNPPRPTSTAFPTCGPEV